MSKPPEWWLKQREPRFGCADVTIVAIAAIAAFVILILILGRADFSTILERVPFGNAATATPAPANTLRNGSTSDDTATAIAISAVTPVVSISTRTTTPTTGAAVVLQTATPTPKPSSIKTVCSLHSGDKPSVGTPVIQAKAGWKVQLDGKEDNADGFHWYEVIINDINAGQYNQNKGWIVDSCLNL